MSRAILATLAVLFCQGASHAAFEITSTPQELTGPFLHNVFHTASASGGESGSPLVWFNLDGTKTSSYDPTTGALTLHVDLFAEDGLKPGATKIGTATATGTLDSSAFNGNDGGSLGSLDWTFNITDASDPDVANFVGRLTGGTSTTTSFFDENYVTSTAGFVANSLNASSGGSMTLWGADGPTGANSSFTDPSLGVDMVLGFGDSLLIPIVPAPPSLALALLGLAGCPFLLRRRKTSSAA